MGESAKTVHDRNAQNRERYHWLKEHGFCIMCGSTYNEPGNVLCKTCQTKRDIYDRRYDPDGERHRRDNRARREWRKAKGLCTECGKRMDIPGTICESCKEKRRDCVRTYRIRKRIEREANEARRASR